MSRHGLSIVRAVCPHDCPDTCSMVVEVADGRAIALMGSGDHPFTQGFVCGKVAHYLDRVYHPDRLKHPLRRVGPKGSGRFERISWDEALNLIVERFRAVAASPDGPQAILPYSYAGTMGQLQYASLDRVFFHRLGASLLDRTICASAGMAGCDYTLGTRAFFDPETIVQSKYIVNWGSNTAVTNQHLWTLMVRARKAGAKIVTIDPFRCRTAERSDWWIPIRPGTDAALALGIMHVLFRDGLQDQDYLDRYCLGTEQLRERVSAEYTPAKVAAITGLPVETIETLARDLATTRPSLIRLNYGLQRHGGGGMAVRTITCLPAVLGSWRDVGGGALLSTSAAYPFKRTAHRLERPDLIPPGTRTVNMTQLAEALHGELAGPPVRSLFVYNSNPAAICPDHGRVVAGLRREDLFTVVHDQFQTDTADYADIVLPATTQLEHFDIHGSYGHLWVQVNTPAIAPLAEAKCNTDVFRLLAARMGFADREFALTDEQLAELALADPGANGKHFPPRDGFAGITLERLKREGPLRLNVPADWAPFAEGRFDTPSGKCEFYSERLAAMGIDPLPTYTPPHEDPLTRPDLAAKYPLQMLSPPEPTFLNSTFVNVPALRGPAGEVSVRIHPSDAEPRGIVTGQWVRIFNARGSFVAVADVGETVRPGVVVSQGVWWPKLTRDGVNGNVTTSTALTDLGAGATFFDNLVQVEAASL